MKDEISYQRAYYQAHKEKLKAQHKAWYQAHRQERLAACRAYRIAHREELNAQRRAYGKAYYIAHKEARRAYNKQRNWALKIEVLEYYSNGCLKCAICGEADPIVLTIDHMNNDGAEHRRNLDSKNFYSWLKTNDCPKGYQVLCRNCNYRKYMNER